MAQITYADKNALNINNDIPDINKVNASDMNEIKSVVNTNADTLDNMIVNSESNSTTKTYSCNYSNNFQLKGNILYQNNSGATGDLTLNDSILNYEYYEIIPYGNESHAIKNRVGTKSIVSRQAFDGTYLYTATETITLSGDQLNKTSIYQWYGALSNPYQNQSTIDWYPIYQVIGYK